MNFSIVAALSSVDKGKQALKGCLREKRVCLCEPVLQPHQTHAFAAQAAGDVFAGAERAGAILEALGKSAPQNGRDILVLRNDAEQRKTRGVDGVVDRGVEGL